jgi:hypothetical protein
MVERPRAFSAAVCGFLDEPRDEVGPGHARAPLPAGVHGRERGGRVQESDRDRELLDAARGPIARLRASLEGRVRESTVAARLTRREREVIGLVAQGCADAEVGRRLGISPGLAYLIATGIPADGSDTLAPEDRERPGFLTGSTQHLANRAEPANPTRKPHVLDWVRQRAQSDDAMQRAAAAREDRAVTTGDPDAHDLPSVLTRQHIVRAVHRPTSNVVTRSSTWSRLSCRRTMPSSRSSSGRRPRGCYRTSTPTLVT